MTTDDLARQAKLTDRQWQVVRMHEIDGLGIRPIGRVLNLSPATVRGHLEAGLKKLASL